MNTNIAIRNTGFHDPQGLTYPNSNCSPGPVVADPFDSLHMVAKLSERSSQETRIHVGLQLTWEKERIKRGEGGTH